MNAYFPYPLGYFNHWFPLFGGAGPGPEPEPETPSAVSPPRVRPSGQCQFPTECCVVKKRFVATVRYSIVNGDARASVEREGESDLSLSQAKVIARNAAIAAARAAVGL